MPTYRLNIEYDGTDYCGWQIQPNGDTVQAQIENGLKTILRRPQSIIGSGRTDAGVHARGQVAHFRTTDPINTNKLARSLNGLTPRDIAISSCTEVHDDFHARFDANRRRYHYYVNTQPRSIGRRARLHLKTVPNFDLMNEAAKSLLGKNCFTSFCKTKTETLNHNCIIACAEWIEEDLTGNYYFAIEGDRFLHGMVRTIVGTLLKIGDGSWPADKVPAILSALDRRAAGPAAPAHGLILEEVGYPDA